MGLDAVGSMSVSQYSGNLFAQLDAQKKGYLEETDLTGLKAAGSSSEAADTNTKTLFAAMDTDGDGKVTQPELSSALTSLAEALMQDLRQTPGSSEKSCNARQATEGELTAYAFGESTVAGESGQLIVAA